MPSRGKLLGTQHQVDFFSAQKLHPFIIMIHRNEVKVDCVSTGKSWINSCMGLECHFTNQKRTILFSKNVPKMVVSRVSSYFGPTTTFPIGDCKTNPRFRAKIFVATLFSGVPKPAQRSCYCQCMVGMTFHIFSETSFTCKQRVRKRLLPQQAAAGVGPSPLYFFSLKNEEIDSILPHPLTIQSIEKRLTTIWQICTLVYMYVRIFQHRIV